MVFLEFLSPPPLSLPLSPSLSFSLPSLSLSLPPFLLAHNSLSFSSEYIENLDDWIAEEEPHCEDPNFNVGYLDLGWCGSFHFFH